MGRDVLKSHCVLAGEYLSYFFRFPDVTSKRHHVYRTGEALFTYLFVSTVLSVSQSHCHSLK